MKQKHIIAETPAKRKAALKKRLKLVKENLPYNWISPFVYVFQEYAELKTHLTNVGCGRSLDEAVISKMEELAEKLKPIKKQ